MIKRRNNGLRGLGGILVLVLLTGCDCVRTVNALVMDAKTGAPIEGARVRERHADGSYVDEYLLTNDPACSTSPTSQAGCTQAVLLCASIFSKDGYVPIDRKFESSSSGDTVFLRAEPWRYKAR